MATMSTSYQLVTLNYDVLQPSIKPKLHYPPPSCTQIDLRITLDLDIVSHECSTARSLGSRIECSSVTHRFNLDVLKNGELAYQTIAPLLTRVGLFDPQAFNGVINEIIEHGLRVANWESNRGYQVLALKAHIWGRLREHVMDDRVLIQRALVESALEFERNNYGMVPAKKSAVDKMLKRVRVVDEDRCEEEDKGSIKKRKVQLEDCVICLEEIKIASAVSKMPCCHTFHEKCIETWLNQSHSCPICRFEMPT